MPRVLALSVSAYWTAFFGMKALAAVLAATGGETAPFVPPTDMLAGDPRATVPLAFGSAIAAALFSWMLVATAAAGAREDHAAEDVPRLAFGVAIGLTTLVLIVATLWPDRAPQGGALLQFVALLASYVAVQLEERHLARRRTEAGREQASPARMMAIGAAHTSLLPRLAARRDADNGRKES